MATFQRHIMYQGPLEADSVDDCKETLHLTQTVPASWHEGLLLSENLFY